MDSFDRLPNTLPSAHIYIPITVTYIDMQTRYEHMNYHNLILMYSRKWASPWRSDPLCPPSEAGVLPVEVADLGLGKPGQSLLGIDSIATLVVSKLPEIQECCSDEDCTANSTVDAVSDMIVWLVEGKAAEVSARRPKASKASRVLTKPRC